MTLITSRSFTFTITWFTYWTLPKMQKFRFPFFMILGHPQNCKQIVRKFWKIAICSKHAKLPLNPESLLFTKIGNVHIFHKTPYVLILERNNLYFMEEFQINIENRKDIFFDFSKRSILWIFLKELYVYKNL